MGEFLIYPTETEVSCRTKVSENMLHSLLIMTSDQKELEATLKPIMKDKNKDM